MRLMAIIALITVVLPRSAMARTEPSNMRYVALVSSYAAGLGQGDKIEDAPKLCMRGRGS